MHQSRSDYDCVEDSRRHPGAHHARPRGRLSTRLQPNHPRDDLTGIAAATYEGLAYATGDALIGINPCIDEPDNIRRLLELTADIIDRTGVPTQNCVLGHITTQMRALEAGAPMDIMFQSLAGTQKATPVSASRVRCSTTATR